MKKDQLEKQLHFKLDFLDLGFSNLAISSFKLKQYNAMKNPTWPHLIKFFS
jgi:Leucine-rich repeat (LRR) protein